MRQATTAQAVRNAIYDVLRVQAESLEVAPEDQREAAKAGADASALLEMLRRMAAARDPQTRTEAYVAAQRVMNDIYKSLSKHSL